MNACPVALGVEMPFDLLRDDAMPSVRQGERRKPNKKHHRRFRSSRPHQMVETASSTKEAHHELKCGTQATRQHCHGIRWLQRA